MRIKISLFLLAAIGCLIYLQQTPTQNFVDSDGQTSAISVLVKPPRLFKPLTESSHAKPSTTPEVVQSSLKQFIEQEALRLYDTDQDTLSIEERLQKKVRALDAQNLNDLALLAMSEHGSQDERILAVYLLTLKGPEAQESLLKVLLSPSQAFNRPAPAHSVQELQRQQEYALRSMALEGIESNLQRTAYNKSLESITLDNPYLNGLLRIVKLGAKLHRPMLKQFIDQNLNKEEL